MTTSASAQAGTPAPKKIEVFYMQRTLEGKPAPVVVSLWSNEGAKAGAPDFTGRIGEHRVVVRIRNGANGIFLSVNRSIPAEQVKENGFKEETIGTANLVINDRGYPVLAIKFNADKANTIWANTSLKASTDLLVKCGLNLETLAKKKAAFEAANKDKMAVAA